MTPIGRNGLPFHVKAGAGVRTAGYSVAGITVTEIPAMASTTSKEGKHIHADVNGAYNIVRKACPGAFTSKGVPIKLYPKRIDVSIYEIREKSPDIFGLNGAGARHHPKLINSPVPS